MINSLPQEIKAEIAAISEREGADAVARVVRFLEKRRDDLKLRPAGQREAKHVVPGLTVRPFHVLDDYPAVQATARALEPAYRIIAEECTTAEPRRAGFEPYVFTPPGMDPVKTPGWDVLRLYMRGRPVPSSLAAYPRTMALLQQHVEHHLYPLGNVYLSALEPGAKIPIHADPMNFVQSFHLGIRIPAGCELIVDGEHGAWKEGKAWLFDHSLLHEAINPSAERRIIMMADFWHPELTPIERQIIGRVFDWVDKLFDA